MDENEKNIIAEIPVVVRDAKIGSFDGEKRTAQMVFSTGSQVRRWDWETGPFIEELSLDPAHVKLDRVREGAVPFLKNHGSVFGAGIEDVLGRVIDAKTDGKVGTATVLFSQRDEVQPIVRDIQDGILNSVSVGYKVNVFEKVGARDGMPILRATDWELFEISSVAIPADAKAQFRGEAKAGEANGKPQSFRCEIRGLAQRSEVLVQPEKIVVEAQPVSTQNEQTKREIEKMNEQEKIEAAKKEAAELARKEGQEIERKRIAEIQKMVRAAKLEDAFGETLVKEGVELDAARARVIDELSKKDAEKPTVSVRVEAGTQDEVKTRRDAFAEAILHRGMPEQNKVTELGRQFAGLTLIEMARESLRRSGHNVNGMSRQEIAKRAMHSTSDFPEITANVVNKSLRDAFQAAPQTFAPFTRRVQHADFKEVSKVQLGLGSALSEVGENGEITYGTMGEAAEKYALKQYAKGFAIGQIALINDDLNAFVRAPSQMGAKARSLESDLVWGILTANAAMADGIALFHASHGNLVAGAAPSVASLGVMRAAMRVQKEMDGEPLNLALRYIMAPVALEVALEQLVSSIQPQQASNVNPFAPGGRTPVQIIVEPRLDAASTSVWYGASGLDLVDMVELATLSGSMEPVVDMEQGFDVLGVKFRVTHAVGAKAIDWRGLIKNPG